MRRRIAAATSLLVPALLGAPLIAGAQQYPERPIRVVVPFPAGGNVDVFGRVLYREVEKLLGQTIVIDNRGGANGIIGANIVRNATPDGYTMLNTSFGLAVNKFIVKNMPFDLEKDLLPVTQVAIGTGYLMVSNPRFPAKTVKELIALAKKEPGKIRYSTAGIGNGQHLAGALFCLKAGVDMLHVPYKGGGPAAAAVVAGEVQIHYPAGSVGVPHVKAGRLHALAFTGKKRLAALPDVPTIAEAALPGFEADAGWHAVFAPVGTPMARVTRFQQAVQKALAVPHVRDHFVNNGYDPSGVSPAAWAKGYRESLRKLGEIAKAAGLEPR